MAAAGWFCEQCQDGALSFIPTHPGDSNAVHHEVKNWLLQGSTQMERHQS